MGEVVFPALRGMLMAMAQAIDEKAERIDAETQERFFNPWLQLIGQAFYYAALGVIFFAFKDITPPKTFAIWAWIAGAMASLTICADVFLFFTTSKTPHQLHRWRALDRYLTHLFYLVTVLAIVMLLPFADPPRAIIFAAYIVGFVPMQVLSDPENATANQLSIIAILGTYAVQLFLQPGWHTDVLAALVIGYGIVMLFAAKSLREIVSGAVSARRQTEILAKELEVSINNVSAERDARSNFLTSASHDLGQPLHAATLFIEEFRHATTPAERDHAMVRIDQSVAAARSIIGDMLSHAQLQADVVVPNQITCTLGDLIQETIDLHEANSKERNVAIRSVRSGRKITTDPALLKRALSNLLANAIAHSGGSRVLIGVRSAPAGSIRICVLDNGIGIIETDQIRIFEDFYQPQVSRNRSMNGFGLGLASVKRITELLSGNIRISNLLSGGAMFCLYLRHY
jgi:signal transduction histidine kinase